MAIVRYLVPDAAVAASFYTEHLGFALVERWGAAVAMVSRGDLTLWLSGPLSSAAQAMPDGRRPEPGGWNRVVIQVENLASTVARLGAARVRFRNEIVVGPGGKQILIEDPGGNPIELFEPA